MPQVHVFLAVFRAWMITLVQLPMQWMDYNSINAAEAFMEHLSVMLKSVL